MASKNLILVHQPGCQDMSDFVTIAQHVERIAPEIQTFIANNESRCSVTRKRAATLPTLVFSPGNLDTFRPQRGKVYAGRPISKIEQMERLRQAGLPVPEFEVITKNAALDRSRLGDLVLVKGSTWHASLSVGTELMRTSKVVWREPASYPEDHPGRHGPMFAQRFIYTGEYPSHSRVLALFGEPLIAYRNISTAPFCGLDADDAQLAGAVVRAARRTGHVKEFMDDPDALELARRAYTAFPEIPLQACDFIRDTETGELYLLEINPGGNTWIFSRAGADAIRKDLGGAELTEQFDAFVTAARVLAERTHAEAE